MKRQKLLGYFLISCWLGYGSCLQAQDLAFSQFYRTPLLTNPSLLTLDPNFRIRFNYRNQPIASGENISTPMFSLDYPFLDASGRALWGLGLSVLNDNATDLLTTNGFSLGGAYHLYLGNNHSLSLGLQGGFYQRGLDIDRITTDNQFLLGFFNEESGLGEEFSNTSVSYLTSGVGVSWHWYDPIDPSQLKAHLGLSYQNFNEPDISFLENGSSVLPARWTFTGSVRLLHTMNFSVEPHVRWIHRLDFDYLNLGTWLKYHFRSEAQWLQNSHLNLGAWYYTNKAFVVAIEFEQPRYLVAISYDIPTANSTSTWMGNGSFELTLSLKLPRRKKRKPEAIPDRIEHLNDLLSAQRKIPEMKEIKRVPMPKNSMALPPSDTMEIQTFTYIPDHVPEDTMQVSSVIPISSTMDTIQVSDVYKIDVGLDRGENLTLNQKIKFGFNSNDFTRQSKQTLEEVVKILRQHPRLELTIVGHTCNVGDLESNLNLSRDRAMTVKKYLIEKGVEADRLHVQGLGSQAPLFPNQSEYNRILNRRVEFLILGARQQFE